MLRTLIHHWRMHGAVIAGAAVATAVLTGALLVGDSVRGSLRDLTLERLGGVDQALAGQRFFRPQLADELADGAAFQEDFTSIAPAILLQGSTQHASSRARASDVALVGTGERFLDLFQAADLAPLLAADGIFPPAVINHALAEALDAKVGEDLLFSLRRVSEVPEGSLLSRKDTGNVVGKVRMRIAAIIPDSGLGQFSLTTHQGTAFTVFIDRRRLAKALDQDGLVNSLLVSQGSPGRGAELAQRLDDLLRQRLQLDDLGLELLPLETQPPQDSLLLQSKEFVLDPSLEAVARRRAEAEGATVLPVLTYLVNRLRHGDQAVPYSTVTAFDAEVAPAFGGWTTTDGNAPPSLGDEGLLLNPWTAEQLQAGPGDEVELTYFVVGEREELRLTSTTLKVAGVLSFEGLAADDQLTQEYPGIAGNDNMADWDPPFPIDLKAIRPIDEEYWDDHRGTPKAFLGLDTGRRLWRNRWGDLTSMRFRPADGQSLDALAASLRQGLLQDLPLPAFGLGFRPVKALALEASGGATDFSGLFVGFSFFLILSAALLVALLFSLGVERRASEVGLLRAVGFSDAKVTRQLLAEGAVLSGLGSLLGLGGAVLYARVMMHGLRTWWLPAVGTSRLDLHLSPLTLALGGVLSLLIVLTTIWWRLRRLRGTSIPALLRHVSSPPATHAGRASRRTAAIALLLSLGCAVAAMLQDQHPFLYAAAGVSLLVGLLALFASRLGRQGGQRLGTPGTTALLRMAVANAARHRGRSLLSTILVASATFMIVTVAAFQQDFSVAELGKDSGTGGFQWVATSDIPLQQDLGSADGRFELGVDDASIPEASRVFSLRLLPGDDTSCLNLYQPRQPRLLGVPPELVERGGFRFQSTSRDTVEPWTLLQESFADNSGDGAPVIPVIGDFNSMTYILKLGMGEDLLLEDEAGELIRLRLVATLATSIFQSELLMSEDNLLRHFPSLAGWSYFLFEAPAAGSETMARDLERDLEDYGFDAVSTAEKLESFHLVQNTYLSTFRSLGGLGLLLGTLGLAIVLLRSVIERRGELAALRAFGFRRSKLLLLIITENAWLLLVGLAIGTAAALLTALSNLLTHAESVPWSALGLTLGGILAFALTACSLAAWAALNTPLLPALKAER